MQIQSQLHCISAHPVNGRSRKLCRIISGQLSAKFSNKMNTFSKFRQRYVELIYVEKKLNQNVTTGHYEMRLYKNQDKSVQSKKDLYSFVIHPMTMTFYANNTNSAKHPFTFVCSCNGVSICFSVHTKYECVAWISVLQQLQWQYQPTTKAEKDTIQKSEDLKEETYSNITPSNSVLENEENDLNNGIRMMEDIHSSKIEVSIKTEVSINDNKRCTIFGILNNH